MANPDYIKYTDLWSSIRMFLFFAASAHFLIKAIRPVSWSVDL